ncbi:MAG: NAD(+)/NADH kinase, partial [Gammaproteobacteria bacterium]|nr:NAD(+)/NADH kinase [Gammaproteobacteria bacterium]
MTTTFKTIVLMGRQQTAGVAETLNALVAYLQTNAINIAIEKESAPMITNLNFPVVEREQLQGKCDLIIVVGGDGSLLSAAHFAAAQNIPVLGINRGRLGFLTDIRPDEIENIGKILKGDYLEEVRFLLSTSIQHKESTIAKKQALNDVVLLPSENNRMIEFTIYIDNQ